MGTTCALIMRLLYMHAYEGCLDISWIDAECLPDNLFRYTYTDSSYSQLDLYSKLNAAEFSLSNANTFQTVFNSTFISVMKHIRKSTILYFTFSLIHIGVASGQIQSQDVLYYYTNGNKCEKVIYS